MGLSCIEDPKLQAFANSKVSCHTEPLVSHPKAILESSHKGRREWTMIARLLVLAQKR
jgi:hypothetical protein